MAPSFSSSKLARHHARGGTSGRFRRRGRSALHRLDDLKTLEAGMAEIERLVVPGVAVCLAEGLRARPRLEILARSPDGVGREERMIRLGRPTQQVELDESRHPAKMGVAREPDLLERFLLPTDDLETVHGDEHVSLSSRSTLERSGI